MQYHSRISNWLNPPRPKTLCVVSVALLLFWASWWIGNCYRMEFMGTKHLWVPQDPFKLGCDFFLHIDRPARIWWQGGDPYAEKDILFPYLPSEMRFFAWVNLMTPRAALCVWLAGLAVIISAAAWMAALWRRRLCLDDLSPIVAVVLVLFSTPVLYAMERGQYDPLSLLFIIAALPLLNGSSKWAQYMAGAVLALAPWVKVYPGLIFVGLIGLRRWRALAGFVVFGLILIPVFSIDDMQKFWVNNALHIQIADNMSRLAMGEAHPCNHALGNSLPGLWLKTKYSWIGLLPGKILGIVLLLIPLSWATYHVYRSPKRDVLAYPYLLWITALATFVPPISNDYNCCFLPLAIIAVWDRRDPLLVQAMLALLLLWWQPIQMSINGGPLLAIKFLGLCAVSVCLVERSFENPTATD